MPYILYATDKNGDGFTEQVGKFDELDDINIRINVFRQDVVITIKLEDEEDD